MKSGEHKHTKKPTAHDVMTDIKAKIRVEQPEFDWSKMLAGLRAVDEALPMLNAFCKMLLAALGDQAEPEEGRAEE